MNKYLWRTLVFVAFLLVPTNMGRRDCRFRHQQFNDASPFHVVVDVAEVEVDVVVEV